MSVNTSHPCQYDAHSLLSGALWLLSEAVVCVMIWCLWLPEGKEGGVGWDDGVWGLQCPPLAPHPCPPQGQGEDSPGTICFLVPSGHKQSIHRGVESTGPHLPCGLPGRKNCHGGKSKSRKGEIGFRNRATDDLTSQ